MPSKSAPTKAPPKSASLGKAPATDAGDDSIHFRELLPDSSNLPWREGRILWHESVTKAKLGCVCCTFCFLPLVMIVVWAVLTSLPEDDGLNDTQRAWLDAHNKHRRKHCDNIEDVKYSLAVEAQAKEAADHCLFEHGLSDSSNGENLCRGHASLQDCVDDWYSEIQFYDFTRQGFGFATGHFTQLVWKSTTEVGCGICSDSRIYVCQYNLAGNVLGAFERNVFEPSCSTPDDSTDNGLSPGVLGLIMTLTIFAILTFFLNVTFLLLPPDKKAIARKYLNKGIRCLTSCGGTIKTSCFVCWTHKYSPFGIWTVEDSHCLLVSSTSSPEFKGSGTNAVAKAAPAVASSKSSVKGKKKLAHAETKSWGGKGKSQISVPQSPRKMGRSIDKE